MKKIFGGINLTWVKVIILAILSGVYTAAMCMIPAVKETSFVDLAATFEVWVLFGIFIIMNSKSAKDSALKCFVFFLISQPLVYLIQDVVNHSNLFVTYYRYWFIWTVFTLPMGFIGYYMKKDKWWGLIILTPILLLVGISYDMYLARTMFLFPRHLLTTIFCALSLIIYPIAIFKNKKIRIVGAIIGIAILIAMTVKVLLNPFIYNTTLLSSGGKKGVTFNDTYKAYFTDESYGDLYFEYEDAFEDWVLNVTFKKAGNTELVLEAPNGEKTMFDVTIGYDTYDITKK